MTTSILVWPARFAPVGYSLRDVSMPSAPGLTSGGQTDQAGGSYSSGTTTITGKNITSYISISGAANVTIRNCTFSFSQFFQITMSGGTLTVENCKFDGSSSVGMNMVAVLQTGGTMTCRLNEFVSCENSIRPYRGTVQYNYIHSPCRVDVSAHCDGIEVYSTFANDLLIDSNVIDIRDSYGQTACVNIDPYDTGMDVTGVTISNNSFIGGSYPLYVTHHGAGTVGGSIVVTGNKWITQWAGDAGSYSDGPYTYGGIVGTHTGLDVAAGISTWSGNTLDGSPLAK